MKLKDKKGTSRDTFYFYNSGKIAKECGEK